MTSSDPLLEIAGLRVHLWSASGSVTVIDGVDLTLARGERLALVGASGAGKTQLALSIPRLSPAGTRCEGSIRFKGEELLKAAPSRLRQLRGAAIGVVHQHAARALAPHLTVGRQLTEVIHAHGAARVTGREARAAALDRLASVGVADPGALFARFPHELSGGLLQRAMLAVALMGKPSLLIADEPTTGLDPGLQATLLTLLDHCARREGVGVVFITHDLGAAAALCERIAVMHAGQLIECGATAAVLGDPQHPQTARLVAATAALDSGWTT